MIGSFWLSFCTQNNNHYATTESGQKVPLGQQLPITLNVYTHNHINQETGIAQQTDVNAQAHSENTNINQNTVKQHFNTFISNAKKSTTGFFNNIISCIKQHKLRTIGASIISSYGLINIMLSYYALCLSRKTSWTRWKKELCNAQLFAISNNELQKQLLVTIHQQCANAQQPIEPSRALVKFIEEINQEIKLLNRYKKILYIAQKMPLSRFIVKWQSYENVVKLHERLLFIKQLFFSWLANYNCNQTQTQK
jgi:hypothetical protein